MGIGAQHSLVLCRLLYIRIVGYHPIPHLGQGVDVIQALYVTVWVAQCWSCRVPYRLTVGTGRFVEVLEVGWRMIQTSVYYGAGVVNLQEHVCWGFFEMEMEMAMVCFVCRRI
eukprot:Gb_18356 [translate_table: standard]